MNKKNVPEWMLERYIHGELPDFKIKQIGNLLEKDVNLQEKIDNIRESDENILNMYPSALIIPSILNRYREASKERDENTLTRRFLLKRVLIASPALALILILIWFVLPIFKGDYSHVMEPDAKYNTRPKGISDPFLGKPHIIIYREHSDHSIEQLKNGDTVSSGDLIQIAYMAGGELYGVIFSIDGNGGVTLHFPNKENEPTELKISKKIYLPNAYQLDNAPNFERFFFITSKRRINVKEVLGYAKLLTDNQIRAKTDNLQLIEGLNQFSVLLVKIKGD